MTRPALATSVDQYLVLRRQNNCDRKLTYALVEANRDGALNRVLELRGRVSGSLRRESSLAFLLTLDDGRAILLGAPATDERMVSEAANQVVRVLARVADGNAGNVVPLTVLAVVYDGELTVREHEAERREAAIAAQRQASHAPVQPAPPSRSSYSSRSGYYVRSMGGAGVSDMAARYLTPEAQSVYPLYKNYIFHCNPRLSESELDQIATSLLFFAQKHRVDPRLVVSVIIAESDFDPRSTSHAGAMGLGQIMPDEARDHGVANPYDPIQNIRTSINLLRMKLDLYQDGSPDSDPSDRRIELALAAYNAGAGAVKKYGYTVPPYKETQNYVRKIMRIYHELSGQK